MLTCLNASSSALAAGAGERLLSASTCCAPGRPTSSDVFFLPQAPRPAGDKVQRGQGGAAGHRRAAADRGAGQFRLPPNLGGKDRHPPISASARSRGRGHRPRGRSAAFTGMRRLPAPRGSLSPSSCQYNSGGVAARGTGGRAPPNFRMKRPQARRVSGRTPQPPTGKARSASRGQKARPESARDRR